MSDFKIIGYAKDYLVGKKYVGSVTMAEPDRDIFGYAGRLAETITADVICNNKKKIKAGTQVVTEIFPLNGRLEEDFKPEENVKKQK